MKNSPLTPLLVGCAFLIGLFSVICTVRYAVAVMEMQKLQQEYVRITNLRSTVRARRKRSPRLGKVVRRRDHRAARRPG